MIKTIRSRSGARITIAEEHSSYGERKVVISGTSCSIKTAEKLIEERLHMPVSVFNEPPQASDVQDEAAVALARMMQSFRLNVPWDEFEDDFHSSVFMQDFTKFGYPKSVVKTRGSKVAVVKFGELAHIWAAMEAWANGPPVGRAFSGYPFSVSFNPSRGFTY